MHLLTCLQNTSCQEENIKEYFPKPNTTRVDSSQKGSTFTLASCLPHSALCAGEVGVLSYQIGPVQDGEFLTHFPPAPPNTYD